MSNPFTTKDPLFDIIKQVVLGEKKLTDAELKKREEIAQAMERDNPGMDMGKKMAIATATAKKVAEEVEELDEASYNKDSEHHKNARKVAKSMGGKAKYHPNGHASVSFQDVVHGRSTVNPKGTVLSTGEEDAKRAAKSHGGKAVGNVVHFKEEVNLDEQLENFWEAYTTMFNEAEDQQQNILLRAMAKDPSDLMKMKRAIKMGDKALTNPALRQEILAMLDKMMHLTTGDPSLLQRTKMGFQKAKKLKMPEEVQLEAIGAKDKQDEGEYGYEGDMAMSQLRTIIRNCQEMMKVLDKETDMPEWVQSKITLATDYLQTANDYLMSELEEEVEQIDEQAPVAPTLDRKYLKGTPEHKAYKASKVSKKFRLAYNDGKLSVKEEVEQVDEMYHVDAVSTHEFRQELNGRLAAQKALAKATKKLDAIQKPKSQAAHTKALKGMSKTPVAQFVKSRKGDGKVRTEEVEKAPFEGGREVKSTKPAAERVKKIAKGMQKQYTKDKK